MLPTGIDRRDDLGLPNRLDVYYGMADSRIGVARLDIPDTLPPGSVADSPGRKGVTLISICQWLDAAQQRSGHPCLIATIDLFAIRFAAPRSTPDNRSFFNPVTISASRSLTRT